MVFTSLWAISQIDIKKIIALSTTSQLRLIIIICCMGWYDLAFLHLVLHGFFKALLFLGRGVTIHNNLTNNQDTVKLNLILTGSTFVHTMFVIGVFGLIGSPFMGSFHSKHLIIDCVQQACHLRQSLRSIRFVAHISLYLSPVLTLGYSLKLLSFISQKPSSIVLSSSYIRAILKNFNVVVPLSLLAISSFVAGSLLRWEIRGGVSTSISLEDIFFSYFLTALFLGLVYYTLLTQRPIGFLYNLSSSITSFLILIVRNLIILFFFYLVEYHSLKKGLKITIPNISSSDRQGYIRCKYLNLETGMSSYLYNLSGAVPISIFLIYFTII